MDIIGEINAAADSGQAIGTGLALLMGEISEERTPLLFPSASKLRQKRSGELAYLCSIVNAKSGRCGEDCRFCAQSSRYDTGAPAYPLMPAEDIARAAADAKKSRAREFSIVTSGKGIGGEEEIASIERSICAIADLGLNPCVSPGLVSAETLARWKRAGLSRYHHNLECAPSFFPSVCSTHSIEEDIEALAKAKAAGLEVCSGGLFGMGESWAQRVELALLLAELDVDSVPVNFLNPIPGTPLHKEAPGVTPMEALKIIAMLRLVLPDKRVIVCGGREANLGDKQELVFEAGADGLMIGNYLTTPGRPAGDDLEMLERLGMEAAAP